MELVMRLGRGRCFHAGAKASRPGFHYGGGGTFVFRGFWGDSPAGGWLAFLAGVLVALYLLADTMKQGPRERWPIVRKIRFRFGRARPSE